MVELMLSQSSQACFGLMRLEFKELRRIANALGESSASALRQEQLGRLVALLPDGVAVPLVEVLEELGIPHSGGTLAAKRAGCIFSAFVSGVTGGVRAMIANTKTVKSWHAAQKKLPPQKR